jgi:hypothetical protein
MSLDPNGVGSRPDHVSAAHPDVTMDTPGPTAWRPDVFRTRSDRHDFDLRRRWRLIHDDWVSGNGRRRRHINHPTFDTTRAQGDETSECDSKYSVFLHKFRYSVFARIDASTAKMFRGKNQYFQPSCVT